MNKLIKYFKKYTQNKKYNTLALSLLAFTFIAVEPSFAQDFSGMSTFFTGILTAVTGPIGIALAGLGVAGVGFMFLLGRMDWSYAIAIIVGIAIIFGAAQFTSALSAAG